MGGGGGEKGGGREERGWTKRDITVLRLINIVGKRVLDIMLLFELDGNGSVAADC